ncbi:uncharacterized protein smim15.L isoform X2 [Xenopus laevis]|uniref:Uncharacterized protein smim15.L isoform X2 n=1 Tax=Xenopus laevis TaxID=8355 RepID=A0A8J1L6K3_XENLA|nr:uncharacterized protein smim15.L isoform X2 [Xenopus laevis]
MANQKAAFRLTPGSAFPGVYLAGNQSLQASAFYLLRRSSLVCRWEAWHSCALSCINQHLLSSLRPLLRNTPVHQKLTHKTSPLPTSHGAISMVTACEAGG